jgi:hypothetical protein
MTGGFTLNGRSLPMAKRRSGNLLDDLRKEMASVRHGGKRWHEKIAPEHLDELAAIKAAWQAGELGTRKKTLARSISARLQERGISDVGVPGVIAWLDKA